MHPLFQLFLEHLAVVRKSPSTIRRYRDVLAELDGFAPDVQPAQLTTPMLQRFASAARRDGTLRAPAGVNLRIAVLRAAFGHLADTGSTSANPSSRLVGVSEPRRVPKHLTTPEVHRLLDHVARNSREPTSRDVAVVVTLWQTALRVSEFARLKVGQFDREAALLRDVVIKGSHVLDVALNRQTVAVLAGYLAERGALSADAPLFSHKNGRSLSVQSVQRLFARWRADLGWTRPLHPHVLRHTHATAALAAGVDIATVADLLRHKGLRTVMVYATVQDRARRGALAKLGRLVPHGLVPLSTTAEVIPISSRRSRAAPQATTQAVAG